MLVVGAGCGLLIALSVPPFGWWPAGWAGFTGLALVLPGQGARRRAVLGLGAGLGQYAPGLWWVQAFSVPGCVSLILVCAAFSSVALLLVPARRRGGVLIGLPALVVITEWVRYRFPLGGFPLAGVALGQAGSPLAPSARLGGSLLLSGETALVGATIAEAARLLVTWRASHRGQALEVLRSRHLQGMVAGCAVAVTAAVLIPAGGAWSPAGTGTHSALRVALVQGGGPRGLRAVGSDPQVLFDRYVAASAALRPPLDLVVWPETVLHSDAPFATTADAAAIASLAERLGATVVAGVEQYVGTDRAINEAVAWAPDGRIVATYVKHHLVPFGEYIPWRGIISRFFDVTAVPYDAMAGQGPALLSTPAGPLGVMVSYEEFFDGIARSGARAGAGLLVVPTNAASYETSHVATEALAAARLRAVETGRWLLQVSTTGYTAVITANGQVLERSVLGRRAVLEATVPLRAGRTVYVAVGDTPVLLGAVLLAGVAWLLAAGAAIGRRRSTRPGATDEGTGHL